MYKYRTYFSNRACSETTISTYSSAVRILMINIPSVWQFLSVFPSAYLFLSFYTTIPIGNHLYMCTVYSVAFARMGVTLHMQHVRRYHGASRGYLQTHLRPLYGVTHTCQRINLWHTLSFFLFETLQIIYQNPIKLISPRFIKFIWHATYWIFRFVIWMLINCLSIEYN